MLNRIVPTLIALVLLLAFASLDGGCSNSGCPDGQLLGSDGVCTGSEDAARVAFDCGACTDEAPVCNQETGICEACTEDTQCIEAEASRCDLESGRCVGCTEDASCTHLADLPACFSGTCVSCTPERAAELCDGGTCDENSLSCTDAPRLAQDSCSPCTGSDQCAEGFDCVPMFFGSEVRRSGYCLKPAKFGCVRPYGVLLRRAPVSGDAADDYCGIDEATTTCEATQQLLADEACATGSDTSCGVFGLDDGICTTVNGFASHCTIRCETSKQCPSTVPCQAGVCGGTAGDPVI